MGLGHSKSAKITGNGNEEFTGLIEEKEGTNDDTKAWRSTRETTNLHTGESFQPNKPNCSDHRQKFVIFLSHSGKQKIFVRQLYRDLKDKGVICFFDEDDESLPVGEDFHRRIFEAAKTCRLAVLLLSKEFLETRWPMLELSAFVEAKVEILPVFFMITPEYIKQIMADNEKWKKLEKSEETRAKWLKALNEILGCDYLRFSKGGDEVDFRDVIVKQIWGRLPTHSQKYPVRCMQGNERMCQAVADFFENVKPNENEIRIAGLYGIVGQGKTILGKAFCNLKCGDFEDNACHLDFSEGDSFKRIKLALQYLTQCPQSHLQALTSRDHAQYQLSESLKGRRVLLVLDNVTEESIGEVTGYIRADMGKNSCILVSARSRDFLRKHFNIDLQSCMRVPSLEENEAISILLEGASLDESTLQPKDIEFARNIVQGVRTYHPSALKDFGGHLFRKYGSDLSKWVSEKDGLDGCGYGLDGAFALRAEVFHLFMQLAVFKPPDLPPHRVIGWLAITCNEEIPCIEKAIEDLCNKGFIESFKDEICIHEMYVGFAQSKAKEMERWLYWKGDPRSTRGLISDHAEGFGFIRLEQTRYRMPSQISPKHLKKLLVLQLIDVHKMSKLHLDLMGSLKSLTLYNCKDLVALYGMENLRHLAWLQIKGVNSMLKLPELSTLTLLQHIDIDISNSQVPIQLGDLRGCFNLREINVRCPSLLELPRLDGLPYLEEEEFPLWEGPP